MKRTKSAIVMVLAVVLCFTAVCPVMGAEKYGEAPLTDNSASEEDAKGSATGEISYPEDAKGSKTGETSDQENAEDDVIYDAPLASSTENDQASDALETKGSEFPEPDPEELIRGERYWKGVLPRVWVGEYDGNNGSTPVRRKYAIQIQTINNNTIKGIGFVNKLENSDHPEYQVTGSYYFEGTVDYSTKSIKFQGTTFLLEIDNFNFVSFSATIDDEMQTMTGSTTAYDGATVDLRAATSASDSAYWDNDESNWFAYKEDELNPKLALECMKNNLLMYGDSIDLGTEYYSQKKGEGYHVLKEKLKKEGFTTVSKVISSPLEETGNETNPEKKDCIHWAYAYKDLTDDNVLVYVILEGTHKEEWYGDFNLSGPGDACEDENQHYSFFHATNGLKQDLEKKLAKIHDKKITYVITGHSRGAACANILGKMLTDEKREGDRVFCYTFATPTVIKNSLITKEYSNIFNFRLDDDFVPYLPLEHSEWQYGRYGTTYCNSAAKLYKENDRFRAILRQYHNYTEGYGKVSYKKPVHIILQIR